MSQGKKLFRVTIEFETFVYCEDDEWEVKHLARRAFDDCGSAATFYWDEVEHISEVPEDWHNGLPWAEKEEDVTVKDLLESKAVGNADKTGALFS